MTTPPITIPDLEDAVAVDPVNDLLIIRQGTNDRKVSPANLGNIRMESLSVLPGQIIATDLLLVGRFNGLTYDNYVVPPQYLGFLNGTNTWFFNNTAPLGWTIVPDSGDRVLATALPGGSAYQYDGVGYKGSWDLPDHTLTIAQIPSHSHQVALSGGSGSSIGNARKGDFTSGAATTTVTGGGQAHNHGNQFRPLAAVGILCSKDKLIGE